jgi:hypothetical protein
VSRHEWSYGYGSDPLFFIIYEDNNSTFQGPRTIMSDNVLGSPLSCSTTLPATLRLLQSSGSISGI